MTSISLELIAGMLTDGSVSSFKILKGIPPQHTLCNAEIDRDHDTVNLFLEVPDDTETEQGEVHDEIRVTAQQAILVTQQELDVANQARAEQYQTIRDLREELAFIKAHGATDQQATAMNKVMQENNNLRKMNRAMLQTITGLSDQLKLNRNNISTMLFKACDALDCERKLDL